MAGELALVLNDPGPAHSCFARLHPRLPGSSWQAPMHGNALPVLHTTFALLEQEHHPTESIVWRDVWRREVEDCQ